MDFALFFGAGRMKELKVGGGEWLAANATIAAVAHGLDWIG
jgi:hypothetical protein